MLIPTFDLHRKQQVTIVIGKGNYFPFKVLHIVVRPLTRQYKFSQQIQRIHSS